MVEEHQLVTRQKAFVLLQVFMGTQRRLKQSELPKKFTVAILRMLALTASENGKPTLNRSALNAILDSLIQDGYLQRKKEQRTEFLHLTDRGIALLLSSPQYEQLEFKMTGESLSRLLKDLEETLLSQKGLTATGLNLLAVQAQMDAIFTETIRGVQTLFGNAQARLLATLTAAPVKPSPPAVPSPATEMPPDGVTTPASSIELPTEGINLPQEIFAEFEKLLREKYTHKAMVPIPAIRRRIAERFGDEQASHAVFDPAVQRLGKQQKVRLVSISDPRDVSDEEMAAAIPGANETFFYLKAAHEYSHA